VILVLTPRAPRGSVRVMRRRVHEILSDLRPGDGVARFVNLALLSLIAANVVASVVETDAEIAARAPRFFHWFEIVSVAIFTVEYVLRLWSAQRRLREATRPMSVVDLVAIAPFYLDLLLPGTFDFRFLRALRLMRLFRLLRITKLADAFAALARVIQAKRPALAVSLAVVVVAMLLAAGAMYVVEHRHPGTQFTSIPRAMWWSIVTITTVGYGDMTPVTGLGQVIAGFTAFLGICALALPVGIISSGYIDEVNRKPATAAECPHCKRQIASAVRQQRD
jgi:voltage-gated potassium channel